MGGDRAAGTDMARDFSRNRTKAKGPDRTVAFETLGQAKSSHRKSLVFAGVRGVGFQVLSQDIEGAVRVDQQKNVKLLSAVIGASAVVVMGAVAVANEQAGTDTVKSAPEATATTTTPPTAPETSIASPETTASTPPGFR
jgi:hypothetical protein